ncbi:MAG: Uncharacterized protein XE11_0727 [Methanomicrobiales archaeon 53_19]|jgi:hypothetical protein|uniref:hypothetical protein n=1 Tax=Methanocalculus sp. TaxID=2004547 RepID=UPI00074692A9|nr:hypothetical protein [Methanocalculus sp.]KUK70388.1 MAG: Uncharacterized protein XD88_0683 [Methanocalculus sp. 52_23]KUL04293.1 MAG: Uncharacterized protein XE11_0727 [Methanomicrobiales archaeon 53_19]HIJ06048.1 hypothetical protein [Methanocalculus sp.]
MSLRYGGYLFIVVIFIVLVAGCTAPPETISETSDVTPEPVQPTPPPPALTPAAVIDPSVVVPATPYPTGTQRPEPEQNPSVVRSPTQTVGYKTVYSETIEPRFSETAMIVEVTQAPLIITAKITPDTITRTVAGISQYGKKEEFSVVVTRPSENAWFECTVRDAGTGEIIVQDGYNRGYTQNSIMAITMRRAGVFHITFGGNFVKAEVEMQLPETAILTETIR